MRINKEKDIVLVMIKMYSKGHDKIQYENNQQMQELYSYAQNRLNKCPFKDQKKFCSSCKIHCYQAKERQLIRKVMKYSGPRLIFKHPILLIKHALQRKGKQ